MICSTILNKLSHSRILVIIYRDIILKECEKKLYQKGASVRAKAILNSFDHAIWINQSTFGIHVVYERRIR